MSSALAMSPAFETRWTVTSGPMRGSVRVISQAQFHIGRSPECEFPIASDPKCSRRHARVEWGKEGCRIFSLAESNPVLVNERAVESALLQSGDMLMLGETEVQFHIGNVPMVGSPQPGELEIVRDNAAQPSQRRRSKSRRQRTEQGSGPKRLVIYAVIGLIGWWLLSPTGKKKEEIKIRTQQQIEADIEAANKLKEAGNQMNYKKLDASVTSRQAQENYIRGFRDYRDGQYERSLVSFQACLALSPEHVLCNRYKRLAERKFSELVQSHVIVGRKYRDQNQFKACRAAFRNVMVMVKDANSPIYKEAKANYEACHAQVEGRY